MKRLRISSGPAFGMLAFLTTLAAPPATAQATGYSFVPLTPCRLIDTRGTSTTHGLPALNAGATRNFAIKGYCGVPTTAKAAALTVTGLLSTAEGFFGLFPAGLPYPGNSNLNFVANQPAVANFAIVALATTTPDLAIVFGTAGGAATAHVVVDVLGYYQ